MSEENGGHKRICNIAGVLSHIAAGSGDRANLGKDWSVGVWVGGGPIGPSVRPTARLWTGLVRLEDEERFKHISAADMTHEQLMELASALLDAAATLRDMETPRSEDE